MRLDPVRPGARVTHPSLKPHIPVEKPPLSLPGKRKPQREPFAVQTALGPGDILGRHAFDEIRHWSVGQIGLQFGDRTQRAGRCPRPGKRAALRETDPASVRTRPVSRPPKTTCPIRICAAAKTARSHVPTSLKRVHRTPPRPARRSTWITTGHPCDAQWWATCAARSSAPWHNMTKPTLTPSFPSTSGPKSQVDAN